MSLQPATVQVAVAFTAGKAAAAELASAHVIHLAEEIMKTMLLGKLKAAAVLLLGLGLAAASAGLLWPRAAAQDLSSQVPDRPAPAFQAELAQPAAPAEDDPPRPAKDFPRRLLAISLHNYAYANPISPGTGPKAIDKIVQTLGDLLRVPEEQVALLSDRASKPFPPTRALIEKTIQQYLDSSRDQDRIVILFVGHSAELGNNAYLVPLLAETENDDTLIPLSWLYERLAKCKARQKILILDVCRYDPVRGNERGRVEKMGATLDAMLNRPPKGVQVLSACSAGQFSYEVENNRALDVSGGVFLNQILEMKKDGSLRAGLQRPEAEIPAEALARHLAHLTTDKVKDGLKEDQTPRLRGQEAKRNLKFDPDAAPLPPLKIEFPADPLFKDGIADRATIKALLDVALQIPPLKAADKLSLDALPPFPKAALAAYRTEDKDNSFRKAIKEAVDLLVKHNNAFQERFPALPTDAKKAIAFKNQIQQEQKNLALVYAALDAKYQELKALQEDRDRETKCWQANYDYVMARLGFRLAQFIEYQVLLGQIRKEELPQLDKQKHTGYRLAAKMKLTDRDGDKIATDAKKLLKKITAEHKGTPWELLAKREMMTELGLEWQPD